MGGVAGDDGDQLGAGQDCPAHGAHLEVRSAKCEVRDDGAAVSLEVTAEERAAITRYLRDPEARAVRNRVPMAARAALKFAGVLLLAAGVVVGLGDGDELDDVGCTVAQQPGGTRHGAHSGQSTDGADDKAPDSGGGSGGGGNGGGPECVAPSGCGQYGEAGAMARTVEEVMRRLEAKIGAAVERFEGKLEAASKEIGGGMVGTVLQIGRDLQAIARGTFELRRENRELQELQGAGLFKFALRVGPEDFQAFAAIIALGNRKAAAEFLGMPLRSFYDRIGRWPARGADYARMFRMLEWRKATDRKMVVRLEDSLLWSGTRDGAENPETLRAVLATMKDRDGGGYPDFLRQILEALQEQNAGNWAGVRDELVGILREEVPQ